VADVRGFVPGKGLLSSLTDDEGQPWGGRTTASWTANGLVLTPDGTRLLVDEFEADRAIHSPSARTRPERRLCVRLRDLDEPADAYPDGKTICRPKSAPCPGKVYASTNEWTLPAIRQRFWSTSRTAPRAALVVNAA
jgi:hypothetical protein